MTDEAKIHGLPELIKRLDRPDWVERPSQDFFDSWRFETERQAKERVPVFKGALRRRITSERDRSAIPTWARVGTNEPTGLFVHQGTKPHWPPRDAITPWAEAHGIPPFVLQRHIGLHGTKANPFLADAASATESKIPGWLGDMAAAIEKAAEAGAT